jgi:hypothetical protein
MLAASYKNQLTAKKLESNCVVFAQGHVSDLVSGTASPGAWETREPRAAVVGWLV